MRRILALALIAGIAFFIQAAAHRPLHADAVSDRASKLHFSSIVLDTHDDTTQRFFTNDYDLGRRNSVGHVDIPRMK